MRVGLVWLVVFLASSAAPAKDPAPSKIDRLIADATKAWEAKDAAKAADLLGDALAMAQRERDLAAEERAADVLEKVADGVSAAASAAGQGRTAVRTVLAPVMMALDPKRHGAFVSAHALAARILLAACETGDADHVAESAAVLTAYAATPKSGKAGVMWAKFAEGVKAARARDPMSAGTAFRAAAAALGESMWLRPSLFLALESVLQHLALGADAEAAQVMSAIAGLLDKDSDYDVVQDWRRAVEARLPTPPSAVKEAFDKAMAPFSGGGSAAAAGGRGGAGAPAGEEAISPLGKAWPKLAPDKPLVAVKRSDEGFEISASFDPNLKATHPRKAGQTNWDADGITLVFADGGVALRTLDLVGTRGQPGERSHPSASRAFYLLAPGETFGVSKSGTIAVSP